MILDHIRTHFLGDGGDLYAERLIREYIRNYREGWIATDRDG